MKLLRFNGAHLRIIIMTFMILFPTLTFAQDASAGVTQALNQWGKYLLYGAAVLVCMVGAAVNMEKIIDKEGTGTRQQGLQNLAVIVLFALVAIAAVQFVAQQFQQLTF